MIADVVGIMAGVFVILAFYAQQARMLRVYAILSNLLFVAYAVLEALMPVMILHAILLPLNLARLQQIRALGRESAKSQPADS